jgi:phosphoribosylaminoimidazole-succinocarboxamide synthase
MNFAEIAAALPTQAATTTEDIRSQMSDVSGQPSAPTPHTSHLAPHTSSPVHLASGKVREIFDLGDALLLVATDRLSAFDVILPDGIPGKGAILTQMSHWWFAQTAHLIPNHLLPDQAGEFARRGLTNRDLQLRSMIVRKLKPLAIECVARGYLIGSGWSSYKKSGEVCGIKLPAGLPQAGRLAAPIFTPTTKAPKGQHDEPIDDAQGAAAIGEKLYAEVKAHSLALYQFGHERAQQAGMILADTKFEFGTDAAGKLYLIDEVLTPDSSRYWPADEYRTGISPPSYDKQFVRDHLIALKWNQTPPGPKLPAEVISRTRDKYLAALKNLIG